MEIVKVLVVRICTKKYRTFAMLPFNSGHNYGDCAKWPPLVWYGNRMHIKGCVFALFSFPYWWRN